MKIFLIASFISLAMIDPATAGQTLKEIMTPPADSADRENLRIFNEELHEIMLPEN